MAAICTSSLTLRATGISVRGQPKRATLPVALRATQKKATLGRNVRGLTVRAANDGFDLDKALNTYKDISYKIPPVVSAATLPVVTLSILSKTFTGSGLPGNFLGTVEGISWLVLFLGAGSLLPRLSSVVAGGDYSMNAIMDVLTAESDGSEGDSATSRVYGAATAKNSALAEQMEDLKKRQAEKDAETPEERAQREAIKAKLAAQVLKNAQKTQDSYNEEKGSDDSLLEKSATETISECMTQENFDKPIDEFNDEDLDDKLNLSKSEIESGAPAVVGKGDDWRMKNFKEAEQREAAKEAN